MRNEAKNGLKRVYGDYFDQLSHIQRDALLDDACDYISSEGADYDDPWSEYARRIGEANLSKYADVLLAVRENQNRQAAWARRGN